MENQMFKSDLNCKCTFSPFQKKPPERKPKEIRLLFKRLKFLHAPLDRLWSELQIGQCAIHSTGLGRALERSSLKRTGVY